MNLRYQVREAVERLAEQWDKHGIADPMDVADAASNIWEEELVECLAMLEAAMVVVNDPDELTELHDIRIMRNIEKLKEKLGEAYPPKIKWLEDGE